jgi:hypothetical protein
MVESMSETNTCGTVGVIGDQQVGQAEMPVEHAAEDAAGSPSSSQ